MFPWKSTLTINTTSATPIYLQIANNIIRLISSGQLTKGHKIPGSRTLSELLEVNRKTVIQAYDELTAQGWLYSHPARGTFVNDSLPIITPIPLQNKSTHDDINPKPDHSTFNFIPAYSPQPLNTIEINDGSPDHRLAPIDWIYKECKSLSKTRHGKLLHKYNDVKGDETLRKELVKYLAETRGMNITSDHILITRGSQMGIFLIASISLQASDYAVVGDSSYDAADWTIQYTGATLQRITVDQEGLNTDELERFCKNHPVRLVYITPHHHFPTTVTLSNHRRIKLLELSLKYNFTIIEDDYDYDFHYSSSPMLPLASLNHQAHVAYIGSFSKIFAPSIRVGYITAHPKLINELTKLRRIVDRQGDPLLERVIAESITSGELTRHLKKTIREYKSRRDHFCKLLKSQLGDYTNFKIPEGGMAVWTNFNEKVKLRQALAKANDHGIAVNIDKQHIRKFNAMRLGFASLNHEEAQIAIGKLSEIIKQSAF
ncbi:MocR-like pyridoxine biosynthesis transcription factor PdxR [Fulvivirga sediminis]|uniref:PLP-dependent aminotransferase family protein n=1 Tax=Fulvivirga sediminis TaxID=2803949 RepID=A0A937F8X3_9BACT|nr:PLP-dependent aminotransferase family protein [Fulvivirga sediminis]MBL3656430.1 PLP-dependent aminotransferase family protein [Fulvivirga sediminis]